MQFINMGANLLIHKADAIFFKTGLQKELAEIKRLTGDTGTIATAGPVNI